MMKTSKIYSDHFYAWEQQYRGHIVSEHLVSVEPVFNYFKRYQHANELKGDDSLIPTSLEVFSSFVKSIYSKLTLPSSPTPAPVQLSEPSIPKQRVIFSLYVPDHVSIKHQDFASFLETLSIQTGAISFEIIASAKKIQLQLTCDPNRAELFASISASFLPQLIIQKIQNDSLSVFAEVKDLELVEFALCYEFIRPLRFIEHSPLDPYVVLFSILENLRNDEQLALQILFHISDKPWKDTIKKSLHNHLGQPFFYQSPEMISAAEQKCLHPQFGVVIRAAICTQHPNRMLELKNDFNKAILSSTASATNRLMVLDNNSSDIKIHMKDMLQRTTHRQPFVINTHELLSLVHPPGRNIVSTKYRNAFTRTKQVPEIFRNHPFVLGNNIHAGMENKVTIGSELMRHSIIIGGSGMGKSTLLTNMIIENMRLGNGACIIDPHGQLVDSLLNKYIPEHRRKDVIVLDPTDQEFPFSLNILKAFSETEKEVLASDIVSAFRKNSLSWGDGLNSIFANAISVFLYSSRGGTLADVRKFLLDKDFRNGILNTVDDQQFNYYWQHEFPLLRSSSVGSILTRLDVFLRPKAIRNMVAQPAGLDFERLMNEKKILFVKLPHGHLGAENSCILGSMILTKFYQAALARQGKTNMNDFVIFSDEVHQYLTNATSVNDILTGARKFHLSLIAATQQLSNISDPAIIDSILTNAAIRICFRLGDADAKKLAEGFSSFTAFDLQNLKVGEAICRIDRPEQDFSLSVPLSEEQVYDERIVAEMIEHSRQNYCVPRATVEKLLLESVSMNTESTRTKSKSIEDTAPAQEISKVTSKEGLSLSSVVKSHQENAQHLKHREMQMLVKSIGERFGFVATIERQLPTAAGQVDVLLTKPAKTIAVEISVHTGKKWEVHNIEKCIVANYNIVISLSQTERQVQQIKKEFEKLQLQTDTLIYFFTTDSFYAFLEKEEKQTNDPANSRGYRVNVSYDRTIDNKY